MHYQRLTKSRWGLEQPLATAPDEERFWAKVDQSGGPGACWPWQRSSIGSEGYGNIWWLGRTQRAHRIAYQLMRGDIPATLTLDHLCGNRACVNPQHLEPVTLKINIQRGGSRAAVTARTGVCQRGHELTPENTYVRPDRGTKVCRACARIRDAEYRSARKQLQ